jgi:shikimate kinase
MFDGNRNIFLIGPMGAGKTTIGRLLADHFGKTFVDSDQVIEERAGAAISWIFDVEREEGFRQREINVIDELSRQSNIVLATGGGVVMRPENRQHLAARGFVVYLRASVAQQVERTRRDNRRPLLQGVEDPHKKLEALMDLRDPLYREIADLIIQTSRRNAVHVCKQVAEALEKASNDVDCSHIDFE